MVKAFTKQQIESGEVAYLLAEGKVLGEQAWGQQLGKDQYPVPGSDNKVIKAAQGDKDANGNDTYWATFSNPTNDVTLSVPSESGRTLNVYNATVSGGKMTLTERNNQVAKEEGVLLKTDGEYVNAKANATNELAKASSYENHLVATPAEAKTVTAETGCKLYRLTYKMLQIKNVSASTSVWTKLTIATTEQVSKRLQERLICKYMKMMQRPIIGSTRPQLCIRRRQRDNRHR